MDFRIFVGRAAIFLLVTIILSVASKNIGKHLSYEYLSDNTAKIKAKDATMLFTGVVIAFLALCELIEKNPNEWLAMKILFYLACWFSMSTITFGNYSYSYSEDDDTPALVDTIIRAGCFAAGIAIIAFVISVPICCVIYSNKPLNVVDREVVSSVKMVGISDYNPDGERLGKYYGEDTFIVAKNGVYRYTYKDNGELVESEVKAEDATIIYYTGSGQNPRIDEVKSYSYKIHKRNLKDYKRIKTNQQETWYEIYIPEGTAVVSGIHIPDSD